MSRMQERSRLDEKITQEREKHFRSFQSGPSSLESGKTSVLSGPSSIDSGKNSSSRTASCMSSLESQGGTRASIRATSTMCDQYLQPSIIANSMSNNSITLQVTTSGGHHQSGQKTAEASVSSHKHRGELPSFESSHSSGGGGNSTKIYVKNSPVRSVIKLENGNLTDNANVFIINKNETISGNNQKEVIQFSSLPAQSRNSGQRQPHQQRPLETQFLYESTPSEPPPPPGDRYLFLSDCSAGSVAEAEHKPIVNNKLNNECVGDVPTYRSAVGLNNSNPLVYRNLLRHNSLSVPKEVPERDSLCTETSFSHNKLNEEPSATSNNSYLSKLKSLNSIDSLATIYQKSNNLLAVGSEPNLLELTAAAGSEKFSNRKFEKNNASPRKDVNLSKCELDPGITEDMYDFPSLTDLSFNSLAALKILQELNTEKTKPTIYK